MPYIEPKKRGPLVPLSAREPANAGELNFQITVLIYRYAQLNRPSGYQALNDVVGALESAKAEFQRRVVADYEDVKRKVNGEVYL